eukprot:54074_1
MAAQPDENKPLRSEDSDNEPDNKQEDPPQVVVASAQDPDPQANQLDPNENKDAQNDVNYTEEIGGACNKCYNWFPIGIFGWLGGWIIIICSIIDMIYQALTLSQLFVVSLIICGALLILLVEMPPVIVRNQRIVQRMQLSLHEWMKLLSRMWGRAIYCCVLSIMCFSELGGGFRFIVWVAGMYLAVLIILYLIFGILAAKKYNFLFVFISKTEVNLTVNVEVDAEEHKENEQWKPEEVQEMSDVDALKQKFALKFDELDEDKDGNIVTKDIGRLGIQANLALSTSECHAIGCYLDNDCIGRICKEDWIKMWLKNPKLFWL